MKAKESKETRQGKSLMTEDQFAEQVGKLVAQTRASQLEIGRLIDEYVAEHGNRYGQGVYKHIAGIAELSERSARQYHEYFRLKAEYANSANLQNLCASVCYQIARLLSAPDAKEQIPALMEKADKERMRTVDVESYVSTMIREREDEQQRGKRKKPQRKKPAQPDPDPDPVQTVGPELDEALDGAVELLREASNAHRDYSEGFNMTNHQLVVCRLIDGLMVYLDRLTTAGMTGNLQDAVSRFSRRIEDLDGKQGSSHGHPVEEGRAA